MDVIALTGGIGAGKSAVGAILRTLGAVVIDADELARKVVSPGTVGHEAVVQEFGADVVGENGEIDRARLAQLVFVSSGDRERLEAIVHPLVEKAAADAFAAAPATAVRIYEIPLLTETGRSDDFAKVVVVDLPDDERLGRLMARGMSETDALARMAAQASRAKRLAIADYVIDNSGSPEALREQVRRLWPALEALE